MGEKEAPPAPHSIMQQWSQFWQNLPDLLLSRLVLIVLALLLAFLAYMLLRAALRRLQARLKARMIAEPSVARRLARGLTVISLLHSLARWAVSLAALLWILAIMGVNLLPLLAGAGVAGLAIGLGAQSLIRDFISGLFIILEGQFAVGDYVSIGGVCGTVEELGLRVTVLRDFYGHRHYFPNGSIAIVKVYEGPYVQWKVELQVPAEKCDEAAAELMAVLEDLSREFPQHIFRWDPPGKISLHDNWVALQASLAVFPEQHSILLEELPARLKNRFEELDISLLSANAPKIFSAPASSAISQ